MRKQKLKQTRQQKERYRKNAKKKAINFLNKKNAAELLKEHSKKQKAEPLLVVEDRLKRKRKAIEQLKEKHSPKRGREFVNSKKNEIYRQNARKKAIKTLNNKNIKLRSVIKSDDNFSDVETIQCTEPYKDTSKNDEIYRRKAKKKATEITTSKKRKVREVLSSDGNFSDAETTQYAEPYKDTSKKDEIYRRKAKKLRL